MTYKTGGWITAGLATIVAGYVSYAALTSRTKQAAPVTSALFASTPNRQLAPMMLAEADHSMNELIAQIRQTQPMRHYQSAQAPAYTIEESFPIDENVDIGDLGELFHEDCEGVCIYTRDSDNRITKVKSHQNPAEPITWYDESNECFQLNGRNFWFYTDASGVMKAWGIGKESGTAPEKMYSPCE